MTKKRRNGPKETPAAAPVKGEGASLEPLLCTKCGAPQAIGEGDTVTCPACNTAVAIPEAYRMMRDARRLSTADAAQLDALYAEVAKPPQAWERVAVVLGYIVGITTLVVLAVGAIVGAVGGAIVGDKLGAGDTVTKIFAGLGAILIGVIAVPFAGEWVVGFVTSLDSDAAASLVTGAKMHVSADLGVAGALYFLGVVPTALAWRTSQSISGVEALQARLAAKPATDQSGAACRRCGAPLDVRPGALGVRCVFCGADNLLIVPKADAAKEKKEASDIDVEVQGAVSKHEAAKRSDRATMWTLLAVGPLLFPLLCAAGWVMHRLFAL